jgi:hypothetical protein
LGAFQPTELVLEAKIALKVTKGHFSNVRYSMQTINILPNGGLAAKKRLKSG